MEVLRYSAHSPRQTPIQALNPLKPKMVEIIFKNSTRTSKKTPYFILRNINWLMLFKKVIAEKHAKHINTRCRRYCLLMNVGLIVLDGFMWFNGATATLFPFELIIH
jgi:hypothetical protein